MSIGFFSKSRAFTLTQATDGSLSVTDQEDGFVKGMTNSVIGKFNGGATGSVGASHTTTELLTIGLAGYAERRMNGLPGLPFGIAKLTGGA